MQRTETSLSVVIPIYKDSNLIKPSVERLSSVLSKHCGNFDIILIDDGNDHEDSQLMDEIAKKNPFVSVLHNTINLNLGISLQRGLKKAEKDLILFNSIDLPLTPEDIETFMAEAQDTDILILQRRSYPGATKWRLLTSTINLLMIKALFPFKTKGMRDFNYTFFIKRTVLDKLLPLAKSPAFTQPEIILRAKYFNLRTKVLFADYHPRKTGSSTLGKPHDIIWSIYDMLRFRFLSLLNKI